MANKKNERNIRYMEANTRFYGLRLVKSTDSEMIEMLEANKPYQVYLKKLIRKDIQNAKRRKQRLLDKTEEK